MDGSFRGEENFEEKSMSDYNCVNDCGGKRDIVSRKETYKMSEIV